LKLIWLRDYDVSLCSCLILFIIVYQYAPFLTAEYWIWAYMKSYISCSFMNELHLLCQ